MTARTRLLVGGVVGLAAGLCLAAAVVLPGLLASGSAVVDGQGRAAVDAPAAGGPFALEIDSCQDAECTSARPLAGAIGAPVGGQLTARADPKPDDGAWLRARVFYANGSLAYATAPAQWQAPSPINPGLAATAVLSPLVAGLAAGACWTLLPGGAATYAPKPRGPPRPQAAQPTGRARRAARTAAPAAPGFGQQTVLTVVDARTKLPLEQVRAYSAARGTPLTIAPTGAPGQFVVDHAAAEAIEVRATGYDTLHVTLQGAPALAEMRRRAAGLRLRVTGSTSGSSLPGVPVRVLRGSQVLAQGRTNEDGEFLPPPGQLQDDDLAETAIGRPGFADARGRVWQAGAGGVLELPVSYEYQPGPALQARLAKVQGALRAEEATWQRRDAGLGAAVTATNDALLAVVSDPSAWGRALLRSDARADTWMAALLDAAQLWLATLQRLAAEPSGPKVLAPPTRPLGVPAAADCPWSDWLTRPLDEQQRELALLRSDVAAVAARAPSLASPATRPWVATWCQALGETVPAATNDVATAVARRLLACLELPLLRWVLSSPGWLERLARR